MLDTAKFVNVPVAPVNELLTETLLKVAFDGIVPVGPVEPVTLVGPVKPVEPVFDTVSKLFDN